VGKETKERIRQLEYRVTELEQKVKDNDDVCPLCGSKTTKSTICPRRFCFQENGPCGQLLLSANVKRGKPYTVFHRTTIVDDNVLEIFWPKAWTAIVNLYFVGGKQVNRREYIGNRGYVA